MGGIFFPVNCVLNVTADKVKLLLQGFIVLFGFVIVKNSIVGRHFGGVDGLVCVILFLDT